MKVELRLGDRPGTSSITVDGVDLSGVTRSIKLEGSAIARPRLSIEIIAEQLVKAEADVRLFIAGEGLRRLLLKYRAQHGHACHAGAQGCVCGLDHLMASQDQVPLS